MNSFVINIFLSVLLIGGALILFIIFISKILSPKKIDKLRNLIKSGNYKLAIKVAKDILSKDPNNVETHYFLGEAYYNEGKHELALIEYKATDKIGTFSRFIKESELRERLAQLYLEFDNLDEALKEYLLLIKKYPNDFLYYFKAGEIFHKKNLREQAIKYYEESLKIKNNYPDTLVNLGILYYETKKIAESEKLLEHALKLDPNNYKIYFYLGMIKKSQNNYKNALKFFETATKDKDLKVKALAERGMIFMGSNKFEDAIIEFERAIKNCSENENINFILNLRYLLASCYEQTRNLTEAIEQWEIIYAKKPDFKNVSEKLTTYQELRMDDKMKDFMTATNDVFIEICKSVIGKMKLSISDMRILSNEGVEFHTIENDSNWRNVKKRPKLVRIYRKSEPIDESILREVQETMKSKDIIKGIVITSSIFTKQAIYYAQERPIQLIDKNEFQNLLKS